MQPLAHTCAPPAPLPFLSPEALAIFRRTTPEQSKRDSAIAEAVHTHAVAAQARKTVTAPLRSCLPVRGPQRLAHSLVPRRQKIFGEGSRRAMAREAKQKACRRAREARAAGQITRAAREVHDVLLWQFHNAGTGSCFPSYERIAEAAGCARSTVALAIKQLEATGLLTWVNRIRRVRENDRIRVVRTSNAYEFPDEKPADPSISCKSENAPGTQIKGLSLLNTFEANPEKEEIDRERGVLSHPLDRPEEVRR